MKRSEFWNSVRPLLALSLVLYIGGTGIANGADSWPEPDEAQAAPADKSQEPDASQAAQPVGRTQTETEADAATLPAAGAQSLAAAAQQAPSRTSQSPAAQASPMQLRSLPLPITGTGKAHSKPAGQEQVKSPASSTGKSSSNNPDDVLQEIFALTAKPQSRENMSQIFALEKEGQQCMAKADWQTALSKFQDMYGLCKEVKYGDGEGRALDWMAQVYLQKGEKARAKSLAENAMEVLSSSTDKKSSGHARVTAAQIYLALDNPLWALQELELAMKDFTAGGLSDNEEAARAMVLAANLASKIGSPLEAVKFYRGAAIHYGQAGDVFREVTMRNCVVSLLTEMGFSTAALEESKKAVKQAKESKEVALIAAALTTHAAAQYALCEFTSAKKTLDEVLALKLENQPLPAVAVVHEAYGHAVGAEGDLPTARIHLEKALAALKQSSTAHHKANVLNGLGVIDTLSGKAAKAVEELRQAADAQSVVTPKSVRMELIIAQNLASALACTGESRAARAELENALRTMAKNKEPDQQILGQVYEALGEICWQLKEVAQADAYFRKSIEIAGKINDDATLWRAHTNLAKLEIALQQSPAESLASAASHFRSPQAGAFLTIGRNPFPSTREETASDLVSLLISQGQVEQALITAEQLKEESFIQEWQRHGGDVKPSDRELYNDLVTERAHLHSFEAGSTPDKLLKNWQDWLRRLQLLAAENRELARLISPLPVNLSDLCQQARQQQATVLDYLVGPKQSFVFLIDRTGKIWAHKLDAGKETLRAQVNTILTAASRSGEEARSTEKRMLQAMFQELLPPALLKLLPTNPDQPLIFVPDGALFNLPFAALTDSQGKYLIESHTISSMPALVSFLTGASRFGMDNSLVLSAPSDNSAEAVQIANLFDPEQVARVGHNQEITQLQEQAKTKAVLHFSLPLTLQEHGLLKSTLPFTSADPTQPSTTLSLFRLNLPNSLAVWSNTQVNAKDSQGSGVKVFARGLAYAGVRSVLLSLWIAPDQSRTTELVEFYKARQQGFNQAQSLRRAQLIAISKDPSPKSWAAFQLMGPGK